MYVSLTISGNYAKESYHHQCLHRTLFAGRGWPTRDPSKIASVTAQPTAGGLAPLYRARTPSFDTILLRHSRGPEYIPRGEHCIRVLTLKAQIPKNPLLISFMCSYRGNNALSPKKDTYVSNLFPSEETNVSHIAEEPQCGESYGCPTTNLVSPEAVPAAKPFARSVALVRVFFTSLIGTTGTEASAIVDVDEVDMVGFGGCRQYAARSAIKSAQNGLS